MKAHIRHYEQSTTAVASRGLEISWQHFHSILKACLEVSFTIGAIGIFVKIIPGLRDTKAHRQPLPYACGLFGIECIGMYAGCCP